MRVSFLIAIRYLFLHRKAFSSFLPIISVVISTAIMIATLALSNGFQLDMTKHILGFTGHIYVYSQKGTIKNYSELIEKIAEKQSSNKHLPAIQIHPVIRQQVIISAQEATGAMLYGVTINDIKSRPLIGTCISQEALAQFESDPNAIIVGQKMMENLSLKVGDSVMVLCPASKQLDLNIMTPRIKYMKVVGTFDTGMQDYDSVFAFVNFKTAQNMFSLNHNTNELEIFIFNPNETKKYVSNIKKEVEQFNEEYNLVEKETLKCADWKKLNKGLLNALEMQRIMMFVLFVFIILMASVGVIGSMISLTQEKKREIAILRTIGASRWLILRIFLIIGLIIGFVGAFLGTGLGIIIARNIDHITKLCGISNAFQNGDNFYRLQAIIDWTSILSVASVTFGIVSIVMIYPAWSATMITPSSALKEE
jgi:lipoprotein-releasing system permease protein